MPVVKNLGWIKDTLLNISYQHLLNSFLNKNISYQHVFFAATICFMYLQWEMFNLLEGQTSLSWIMRVQIALDAARGLEYIHEHTKTHYVHRDIKSSNILLDSAFRAKVFAF